MDFTVAPAVDESTRRALVAALETAGIRADEGWGYEDAWRRAGLRGGVEGDDLEADYAFVPRSTRGATRA